MEGTLWFLKRCNLFEQLGEAEAERLERRALMRRYKRRELVYSPTEPGQSVLVLASGRIKIKDITPEGKESILTFIEEGELFGELALLEEDQRQEYAEAVESSRVLLIPREEMLWLMEARPDIALSVTKLIGLRRKRVENRLKNILFLPSRTRMVRLIVELMDRYGDRRGNTCTLKISLSHQELASLIGVTRETVTLVLGQLHAEGVIDVKRRRVIIKDTARLLAESGDSTPSTKETPESVVPRQV